MISSFIGLPLAAWVFGSGHQITHMATMVGYPTFLAEHVLYGLALGHADDGARRLPHSPLTRVRVAPTCPAPHWRCEPVGTGHGPTAETNTTSQPRADNRAPARGAASARGDRSSGWTRSRPSCGAAPQY